MKRLKFDGYNFYQIVAQINFCKVSEFLNASRDLFDLIMW